MDITKILIAVDLFTLKENRSCPGEDRPGERSAAMKRKDELGVTAKFLCREED